MTGSNGIDVSQYQKGLDLSTITGLDFVIAKATEGTDIADPEYDNFAAQAERAGVQFGAYHFLHAEELNMRAQADFFCSVARPRSGLSVWIDYETYGATGQVDAEMIGYFAAEVKRNTGNKQKIGIYCNRYGLSRIRNYLHEIPYSALWIADPDHGMMVQGAEVGWQVHQYEVFEGIDRNWSVWSPQEWASLWKW